MLVYMNEEIIKLSTSKKIELALTIVGIQSASSIHYIQADRIEYLLLCSIFNIEGTFRNQFDFSIESCKSRKPLDETRSGVEPRRGV